MCLILLAFKADPAYKLIIAANRDEYHDRPTAPAGFWKESPHLLAGRDLRAGGTWIGITREGRIGAVTNYRDPASVKENAPSRGRLVSNFLMGREGPVEYLEKLAQGAERYNGFNLIIGEKGRIYWYSNRGDGMKELLPGIHGLSNHLLDTPWPKVVRGKDGLAGLISRGKDPFPEKLFNILRDRTVAHDDTLPDTGVGLDWERILSPIFILSPGYGTRSSTILFIDLQDHVPFIEKTFDSDPDHASELKYEFTIEH